MTVNVITGDAVDVLRGMPDASVHCCVTSPPYNDLRVYGGYSWDFEGIAHELYRVMCDGGVVCWNVGDSVIDGSETLTSCEQKIHFRKLGFRIHDTMIWQKLNFANPETVRYHQIFEYVFILSKGKPRAFNPIRDSANATAGRVGCLGENTYAKRDGERSRRAVTYVTEEAGMRGNVWTGKTRGQEEFCKHLDHPAMMPRWLARDLIRSWSNPGDTVLDPHSGSGTTGLEADRLQRNAILIDSNPAYAQMARERISGDCPMFTEVTACVS